jgi:hypothetical protein
MAAIFHLGDREGGGDLLQWLFSMMTMGIFSYQYVPLKVQGRCRLNKEV